MCLTCCKKITCFMWNIPHFAISSLLKKNSREFYKKDITLKECNKSSIQFSRYTVQCTVYCIAWWLVFLASCFEELYMEYFKTTFYIVNIYLLIKLKVEQKNPEYMFRLQIFIFIFIATTCCLTLTSAWHSTFMSIVITDIFLI